MNFKALIWITAIFFLSVNLCLADSEEKLEISHYNDMLELREPLGKVRETITKVEMPELLKGGVISTNLGKTDYGQYIRFNDVVIPISHVPKIVYTKAGDGLHDGEVKDFMYVEEGRDPLNASTAFFEYELEFESGLKSNVNSKGDLIDLHGKEVNILGAQHIILETDLDTATAELTMTLVSAEIRDFLYEGDQRTYNIKGEMYNLEVLNIDSTNVPHTATFNINGEITDALAVGEHQLLNNGKLFVITDMNALIDRVSFALDSNILGLLDQEYNDSKFSPKVKINLQEINNGFTSIMGFIPATNEFEITAIQYRLAADVMYGFDLWSVSGEEEGGGIRNFLKRPEAMLGANWDIEYAGLTGELFETEIKLDTLGNDSYKLIFENQQGLVYNISFVTNENNIFKYGNDKRDLVFKEGFINLNAQNSSEQDFTIGHLDYFVLSDTPSDNDAISHVVMYDRYESSDRRLKFTDMATSIPIEVTYNLSSIPGTIGYADLIFGGNTYKVWIADTTGTPPLAIDLNNDDLLNSSEVRITTKGGAILDLGNHHESVGGTWVGLPGNNGTWDNTSPRTIQNNLKVELTTRAEDFEENSPPSIGYGSFDEYTAFKIENKTNETMSIINQISSNGGIGNKLETPKKITDYHYGMTDYGARFVLWDYSEAEIPEKLSIIYPLEQIEAKVFITHKIINASIPDLTILNMEYSPLNPEVGDLVTANVTIANLGNVPVGNFDWAYDFDYKFGKDSRGLNSGENMTIQLNNVYTEPGDYTFYFELDPFNKIEEISELNNKDTMEIFVNGDVDLVPELKYARQSYINPKEVIFVFEINNLGDVWVEDVAYDISFGDNSGTGGLISNKIYPNNSYTLKINHKYSTFNEYKVVLEVDPQNTIEETNEKNNLIENIIQVRKLTVDGSRFITNITNSGSFKGFNAI
jgi:hypothetical protein